MPLTIQRLPYTVLAFVALLGVLGCGPQTEPKIAPTEIFTDRALDLGLDFVHFNGMSGEWYLCEIIGSGAALFDYDNDGDLDIYLVQGAMLGPDKTYDEALFPFKGPVPPRDRLYRNDLVESGTLHFIDVTDIAGIEATGYGMGVAIGDIDNDGFADLYITNFGPNQMWRNKGDGTFTDITSPAEINDTRWSTSAAFVDYDRDGFLDLFVTSYVDMTLANNKECDTKSGATDYCSPLQYQPYSDRLWHNLNDGTFEDMSSASGIAQTPGTGLGVVAADFNEDDWPDIYVANDGMANHLWINQGDGRFVDEALLSGTAFNQQGKAEASMGVDAADFDGDGDEDLFMTHLARETNTLYRNDGNGLFVDHTAEAGLGTPSRGFTGFGTAWLDYDNDGRLDLAIANGAVQVDEALSIQGDLLPLRQQNQLLRHLDNGRFAEVGPQAGASFGFMEVSRGIALGDVDNDGDADLLVLNNSGPARLLINNTGQDNAWIGFKLVDHLGGRDQYGAQVRCVLDDGRALWRCVRAAASYCSSNDPRILFGLGRSARIKAVEAHWPDGQQEQWSGAVLAVNSYHLLQKGTGQPLP